MNKLFLGIAILFLISINGQSQVNEKMAGLEMQLVHKLRELHQITERSAQIKPNQEFEELLRETLANDEAFNYPFDSLSTLISTKKSPDGAFRIFNWNLQFGDYNEHKYHCLIMKKDPRKDEYVIIELWDKSANMGYDVEFDAHTEKKWFGCLYYDIIPIQKGSKTIYTLLGWDGNNMLSNKKVIETMKFHRSDKVKFGEAMFVNDEEKTKRRIIFQYNEQSVMSLKHQETKKSNMLIFDHLSPTAPNLEGMKDWYVTDLSFDAYILEKGKWKYLKDVDARTGKKFKTKFNNPSNP